MKILLRASNLFLFLMQISVHFDVRILHSRLKGSLLTQINRRIVIRLHCRAADLDVVSLAQPDGCCWSANFQSAKRHPSYALHTPTAVIQCVIVSKGHSFEPVPFRNINANNLEKISMANYEDECVCQFRDAPHWLLHVLQFPPARVLTHTTRTNQRCAKNVHYLVLLFSHTRDLMFAYRTVPSREQISFDRNQS